MQDAAITTASPAATAEHPLRAYRNQRGISLGQMAGLLDTSKPTVSRIERGVIDPSFQIMRRITAKTDGEVTANMMIAWAATDQSEKPQPAPAPVPQSRADARLLGSLIYNSGRRCANGHKSARYTQSALCVACVEADATPPPREAGHPVKPRRQRSAAAASQERAGTEA